MDEQLLTILKLCLLALLYLFFLRVLRAVWTEIRGPKVVTATPRRAQREAKRVDRKAAAVQLAIVEPAALKGRRYDLAEELTVGREGQLFVEDLGSTNGTYLNRKKVQGPQVMRRGDRLQVGNTVMELV